MTDNTIPMNTIWIENPTESHPAGRRVGRVGRTLVTTFWLSHVDLLGGDCHRQSPAETSDPVPAGVALPSHTAAIAAPVGPTDPGSLRTGLRRIERSRSCPAKVGRYAAKLLLRFDRDRNGLLEAGEWSPALGSFAAADTNADGHVSAAELSQLIWLGAGAIGAAPPAGRNRSKRRGPGRRQRTTGPGDADFQRVVCCGKRLAGGVRRRFAAREAFLRGRSSSAAGPAAVVHRAGRRHGDGQLTLSEFSLGDVSGTTGGFESYDLNHDGILTAEEYMAAISSKPAAKRTPSVGTK